MSIAKAFEKAIEAGDANEVRALLRSRPELIQLRLRKNLTPLLLAAYHRRAEIAGVLLEHGAVLDVCSAAVWGRLEALNALLTESPARARTRSPDGYTALHLAVGFDQKEAAEILLRFGADASEASNNGRMTPLHWAASVPIAELLVAHGADVNSAAGNGSTALHFAAATDNPAMVRWLLAHGADPTRKTKAGQTPWAVAVKMRRQEIADLLFYHRGATGSNPPGR